MCYEVIPTPKFEEDLDYYERKRNFKHIEDDINKEVEKIEEGVLVGYSIFDIHLNDGEDVYKVRAVNTDTKKGKSNGYRIIYYAIKNEKTVFLLTVYYKKDDKRIPSRTEISELINKYCL